MKGIICGGYSRNRGEFSRWACKVIITIEHIFSCCDKPLFVEKLNNLKFNLRFKISSNNHYFVAALK